jgi:hypothetical protein
VSELGCSTPTASGMPTGRPGRPTGSRAYTPRPVWRVLPGQRGMMIHGQHYEIRLRSLRRLRGSFPPSMAARHIAHGIPICLELVGVISVLVLLIHLEEKGKPGQMIEYRCPECGYTKKMPWRENWPECPKDHMEMAPYRVVG